MFPLEEGTRPFEDSWQDYYDRLSPTVKARLVAVAEARGCDPIEVMIECVENYQQAFDDPITGPALRADFDRHVDRLWFPLGHDPQRGTP